MQGLFSLVASVLHRMSLELGLIRTMYMIRGGVQYSKALQLAKLESILFDQKLTKHELHHFYVMCEVLFCHVIGQRCMLLQSISVSFDHFLSSCMLTLIVGEISCKRTLSEINCKEGKDW